MKKFGINKDLIKNMRRLERRDRISDLSEGRHLNRAQTFKTGREYDRSDRSWEDYQDE